jgi:hypothetical protein
MAEWHEVAFHMPKLETLTEIELENLFYTRDGIWSRTTKEAQQKFEVKKIDLNEVWASCAPDWECPGCNRSKTELFRVTKSEVLLAQLHSHHDHLMDYFQHALYEKLGKDWQNALPEGVRHLETLGSHLVARFERTRVCIDCNAADGTVKSRNRDIPKYFSFRPSEIRRFVTPTPNKEHSIDFERANDIFCQVREDFERRFVLLKSLVALALAGGMTRERGNLAEVEDPHSVRHLLYSRFARESPVSSVIHDEIRWFNACSISRDGTASRPKKKKVAVAPTEAEVAAYDGGGALDLWNAAPADWRCPACWRDRGEILRRSNNPRRLWSGRLVRHTEYILATPTKDENNNVLFDESVDRHEYHLICLDCSTILTGVKSRLPAVAALEPLFQLRDMAAVATAAPHLPHEVDWDAATERARASRPFVKMVASYQRHLNDAVACRAKYRSFLSRSGGDEERAWARLRFEYADEIKKGGYGDDLIVWLLSEADRIGIDEPYRHKPRDGAVAH